MEKSSGVDHKGGSAWNAADGKEALMIRKGREERDRAQRQLERLCRELEQAGLKNIRKGGAEIVFSLWLRQEGTAEEFQSVCHLTLHPHASRLSGRLCLCRLEEKGCKNILNWFLWKKNKYLEEKGVRFFYQICDGECCLCGTMTLIPGQEAAVVTMILRMNGLACRDYAQLKALCHGNVPEGVRSVAVCEMDSWQEEMAGESGRRK